MNPRPDPSQLTAPDDGIAKGDVLLDVRNVSLAFGGVKAITDISLNVMKGEIRAIIGPNGAGKTSIFNSISGVYRPQHGDIRWKGATLMGMRPDVVAAQGIARTFQNIELFPRSERAHV